MLDGQVKDYAAGHLLYIGRHSFDIKGGELLLPAFEHALRQRPDLKLVIIGDAADPKLARHLPTIRANPAIEFHQSGTPHFVDLVRGAALYAAPAPAEPWGLVYLEAMMCETPVLALDRNAMRQLTDGGRLGFLVQDADPTILGDAIVAAMSDPDRLGRMGRGGRAFVEANFTWAKVARTIIDRLAADRALEQRRCADGAAMSLPTSRAIR
nr:glycosyltransferase [Sphingomonas sp. IC-56]